MRVAQLGEKHWNWGNKWTQEQRDGRSLSMMGKKRGPYKPSTKPRKPITVTEKLKASRAARKGTQRTPESCEKQSATMIASNRTGAKCAASKKVDQYTTSGVYIKTWDSAKDAGKEYGITGEAISNCIRKLEKGIESTSGGFKWGFERKVQKLES